MFNMWRFMGTDPTEFRQVSPPSTNLQSATRSIICLILFILITSILTVASVYEHFTNICIGLLLISMMFFIVFSITIIRTPLMRNNAVQPVGTDDSIWTTVADHLGNQFDEQVLRDPPSYDTVIQDSKYSWPLPPPYSSVVCSSGHLHIEAPCKSTVNVSRICGTDDIIINVSKLSNSSAA